MREIVLKDKGSDKKIKIQFEGFKTRWDMLEALLFAIYRYFNLKRPGEVRYVLKLMLVAYRNSIERGKYKEFKEQEQKRLDKSSRSVRTDIEQQ